MAEPALSAPRAKREAKPKGSAGEGPQRKVPTATSRAIRAAVMLTESRAEAHEILRLRAQRASLRMTQ